MKLMTLVWAFLLTFSVSCSAFSGNIAANPTEQGIDWVTNLEIDFRHETKEHFRTFFYARDDLYESTWDFDSDGLHMRVIENGGTPLGIGAYTYEYYENARVTVVASVPADRRQGTVFAVLWALSDQDPYYEIDGVEIPGFEEWIGTEGQANIHYGLSYEDKIQNPSRFHVPLGEDVEYQMEWNNEYSIVRVNGVQVLKLSRKLAYKGTLPMDGVPMKVVMSLYYNGWAGTRPDISNMPDEMIIKSLKIEVPK